MKVIGLLISFSLVIAEEDYCGADYSCLRQKHVFCKYKCFPGYLCKKGYPRYLTTLEKTKILQAHNYVRDLTARNFNASNMVALEWSIELARLAQRLVMQCFDLNVEDVCLPTKKYPNLTVASHTFGNRYVIVKPYTLMVGWNYRLQSYFKIEPFQIPKYSPEKIGKYSEEERRNIPYYILINWAKVTEVGCGITLEAKKGLDSFNLLCFYQPGGNVAGEEIFKLVPDGVASECPEGYKRGERYGSLCVKGSEKPGPKHFEDSKICKSGVLMPVLFNVFLSLCIVFVP